MKISNFSVKWTSFEKIQFGASDRQKLCAWTALFIFFSVLAFFPPCFKSLNFGVTSTSERFIFLVEDIETFAGFLSQDLLFSRSSSVGIEPGAPVMGT
jgi:hypothetical protein